MCVGGRLLERADCTVLGHDREQRETCMLFGADWWNPVTLRRGNEGEKGIKGLMGYCGGHRTERQCRRRSQFEVWLAEVGQRRWSELGIY